MKGKAKQTNNQGLYRITIQFYKERVMIGPLKIFSGSSNRPLAEAICHYAGVKLGKCEIMKFSNENIKVSFNESLRGKDVFIVQSARTEVNESIMELLIMIDAAKHASAARITAVTPYLPYVRSDKKDEPRISITARLIADLLEISGANRVMTMNLHSPQAQGFFRIPCDHLLAGKILCDYWEKEGIDNCVVVAPDAGSAKLAGRYAIRLSLPLAILDKRRKDDSESPVIQNVIGDHCIIEIIQIQAITDIVEGVAGDLQTIEQ